MTLAQRLNGNQITSSNTLNVLGVNFDSKLCWAPQVSNAACHKKSLKGIEYTHDVECNYMQSVLAVYIYILLTLFVIICTKACI